MHMSAGVGKGHFGHFCIHMTNIVTVKQERSFKPEKKAFYNESLHMSQYKKVTWFSPATSSAVAVSWKRPWFYKVPIFVSEKASCQFKTKQNMTCYQWQNRRPTSWQSGKLPQPLAELSLAGFRCISNSERWNSILSIFICMNPFVLLSGASCHK